MNYLALVLVLFIPAIFGANGQIWKLFVLSLSAFLMCEHYSHQPKAQVKCMKLGLLVLLAAYLSTCHSRNLVGIFGDNARVEGWVTMVSIFTFGWLCFWKLESEVFFTGLVASLVTFIGAMYLFNGWDALSCTLASKLGTGLLVAQLLPILIFDLSDDWILLFPIVIGAWVIGLTECRSAILAVVISVATWAPVIWTRRHKVWIIGGTLFCVTAVIMAAPMMRHKIQTLDLHHIGHGVRSNLLLQLWHHGIPALGYGMEEQVNLITHNSDFEYNAIYDRFHNWIADVAASGGWVSVGLCLVALVIVFKTAYNHRRNSQIVGLAASLQAFLICGVFNPAFLQTMTLATICASGIFNCEQRTKVGQGFEALCTTLRVLCLIVATTSAMTLVWQSMHMN